jgi:hypothetical protein
VSRRKISRIVVDGVEYFWAFSAGYEATGEPGNPHRCHDGFRAYLASNRNAPLVIHFVTWDDGVVGGPLRTGAPVVLGDPATAGVNLFTPRWAATLIRYGFARGWQPEGSRCKFVIEDGVRVLAELNYAPTG